MPFAHKGVLTGSAMAGWYVGCNFVTKFRRYKLTSQIGFLFGLRVGVLSWDSRVGYFDLNLFLYCIQYPLNRSE